MHAVRVQQATNAIACTHRYCGGSGGKGRDGLSMILTQVSCTNIPAQLLYEALQVVARKALVALASIVTVVCPRGRRGRCRCWHGAAAAHSPRKQRHAPLRPHSGLKLIHRHSPSPFKSRAQASDTTTCTRTQNLAHHINRASYKRDCA